MNPKRTHALLWWWLDDPNLPDELRGWIADEANEVFVSAASIWEMAIKHGLGKLGSVGDALPRVHELIQADGFQHLPMQWQHCLRAAGHDRAHRDPFDRMLAAQAELERLTLLSCDPQLAALGAPVRW